MLGGGVGIADHLTIGDGARVGARSGVSRDIPAGATYFGYPARPHREAMRAAAAFLRLPQLIKRVRALETAVHDRNE
jgi:UDP-3-O-[3-hydroxymyristoyl] glucosamine N-acyltransferase